jgi:hypothetical protein
VFTWDLTRNYTHLQIWNANQLPFIDSTEIIFFDATSGGIAWLTESGMTSINLDLVELKGDGSSLAINPTDLPPNQIVSFIGYDGRDWGVCIAYPIGYPMAMKNLDLVELKGNVAVNRSIPNQVISFH